MVEEQGSGPEPLPHKHSWLVDQAWMELVEPTVEEQNLEEDLRWDPALQEDGQEEGRSWEALSEQED